MASFMPSYEYTSLLLFSHEVLSDVSIHDIFTWVSLLVLLIHTSTSYIWHPSFTDGDDDVSDDGDELIDTSIINVARIAGHNTHAYSNIYSLHCIRRMCNSVVIVFCIRASSIEYSHHMIFVLAMLLHFSILVLLYSVSCFIFLVLTPLPSCSIFPLGDFIALISSSVIPPFNISDIT